jgi:hypothetical protein
MSEKVLNTRIQLKYTSITTENAEKIAKIGDFPTALVVKITAPAAAIETLTGRMGVLETKFSNMAEDMTTFQEAVDELEISYIETIIKIAMRLVLLERPLSLQPLHLMKWIRTLALKISMMIFSVRLKG